MGPGRQWEARLKMWDEAFAPNLYRKVGKLSLEGFVTTRHFSLEEAAGQEYRTFEEGAEWGGKWEYGWFRCHVVLPKEAKGKRVLLHLGPSLEMLVYVNGEEAGSIDKEHDFVQLSSSAVVGGRYEIYAEAYAGHGPRLENGGIYPEETVPVPEPPEYQCKIEESHYGVWNEQMFQAYADYHTLYELWKVLPDSSLRKMRIEEALKAFTFEADFELQEPFRTESVCRARRLLQEPLRACNGSSAPLFSVFGQSHLDLAWLWPWEETRRKTARTYANQVALMERYPEYRFLLCEPPILENLKRDYPKLYRRVKEKVREGNFIPEGAMWVEGDTNMAGGESLIRQFVWGKRWCREELGVESVVAWMPDTFGFSGALPQIMKGCGVEFFATQKLLHCDPECEQFPYNFFWWEGIDGSRILSHIYKRNNEVFSPAAMVQRWEKDRNQRENLEGMLFPYGYGDGGGGPTELMVEMVRRCQDLEGAPKARQEGPEAYFRRLQREPVDNVYYGELYLAWHRGTYTAQARIKRKIRQAESALRQAEFLAGLLRLKGRWRQERTAQLNRMWKVLLFNEFHDILPGTSIRRVNEETEIALDRILGESLAMAEALLRELAGEEAIFNSLSWEREIGGLRVPACGYVRLKKDEDAGREEPERKPGGKGFADDRILVRIEGNESVEPGECEQPGESMEQIVIVENSRYRAEVDRQGRIVSLQDKSSGYEYAKGKLNELRMYRDVNVTYDAWELGRMYEQVPVELEGKCTLKVRREEEEVCLEVCREEPHFNWRQEIVFRMDSPRIEFRTRVDWRERHKLLKVAFPTSVYTKEAIEEIQFGYLKRPTHKSRQYERDLYETCHHRYAALSDGKNGLAILNDCKYGISAQDSTLALTLLRAPVIPDMEADRGEHEFTYAICLFDGPFTESNIVREAYELNTPVTVSMKEPGRRINKKAAEEMERIVYFSVDRKNVILETCKPAMDEENGVVLRLYECMGSAVKCRLSLPQEVKRVWTCNMLEERQTEIIPEKGAVELEFCSFEIRTLLLEAGSGKSNFREG